MTDEERPAVKALLARFPQARIRWSIMMPHTPKTAPTHDRQLRGFTLSGYELEDGRIAILQEFTRDEGWAIYHA